MASTWVLGTSLRARPASRKDATTMPRQRFVLALLAGLLGADGFGARTAPRRGAMTMRARKLGLDSKKKAKKQKVTLTKVPGITAPEEKKLKGWALEVAGSESVRLTAGTCNGKLYVLEAACSCCAWDLEKGDLRGSVTGEPSVACGLCGQTYSLVTGEPGGAVEKQGLGGFVGGLARRAPTTKKARTQVPVRADVRDGDVYLDLGSKVFGKGARDMSYAAATEKMQSGMLQGD